MRRSTHDSGKDVSQGTNEPGRGRSQRLLPRRIPPLLLHEHSKPFFDNNESLPPVLSAEFVSKYARLKFYAPERNDEDYIDIVRNDQADAAFDPDDPRMRMVIGPGAEVVREEEQRKILASNYQHFGKTSPRQTSAMPFAHRR